MTVLPVLVIFLAAAVQAPAQARDSGHTIVAPAVDTARAASPELEELTREVASQLRCPVCQGLSINDSPAELAVQMKDVIREQLASGRTPDEVKAYFVGRYGEWVLLAPEPRGMNLMVYALPLLALVAGAALIAFAVRRWAGRGGGGTMFVAAQPVPEELDEAPARRS